MKKWYSVSLLFVCIAVQSVCINMQDLTLDQKIGQLFMVSVVADEELAKDYIARKTYRVDKEYVAQLITDYHIGGIIFMGKSDPEKQKERTVYFQNISAIPLLVGQDLEPGKVGIARLEIMRDFPNNETLGAIDDEERTYNTAVAIGAICKNLGVHV